MRGELSSPVRKDENRRERGEERRGAIPHACMVYHTAVGVLLLAAVPDWNTAPYLHRGRLCQWALMAPILIIYDTQHVPVVGL
jgi:hypothetical protein